jgi:hypothetical protein
MSPHRFIDLSRSVAQSAIREAINMVDEESADGSVEHDLGEYLAHTSRLVDGFGWREACTHLALSGLAVRSVFGAKLAGNALLDAAELMMVAGEELDAELKKSAE